MRATGPAKDGPFIALTAALGLLHIAFQVAYGWGVDLNFGGSVADVLVELALYVVAFGALWWFVVGIVLGTWQRYVPLVIAALALALHWFGDVERLTTRWNFESRLKDREAVVELVRSGQLAPPDVTHVPAFVDLPARYRGVSASGRISVARHAQGFSVTFYVRREGMFPEDNYTGFIYRSGAGQPETGVEDTYRFTFVESWAPHWFYVGHT